MPQDVKLSPDGRVFYVADMMANGVWLVDAKTFGRIGFTPTGAGAHGLYASRDSKYLYVSNRSEGSVSVVSFATRKVAETWSVPAAAALTWEASPPTARSSGSRAATTRRSTRSTPRREAARAHPGRATARTGSASTHSRDATRSGTRASFADAGEFGAVRSSIPRAARAAAAPVAGPPRAAATDIDEHPDAQPGPSGGRDWSRPHWSRRRAPGHGLRSSATG